MAPWLKQHQNSNGARIIKAVFSQRPHKCTINVAAATYSNPILYPLEKSNLSSKWCNCTLITKEQVEAALSSLCRLRNPPNKQEKWFSFNSRISSWCSSDWSLSEKAVILSIVLSGPRCFQENNQLWMKQRKTMVKQDPPGSFWRLSASIAYMCTSVLTTERAKFLPVNSNNRVWADLNVICKLKKETSQKETNQLEHDGPIRLRPECETLSFAALATPCPLFLFYKESKQIL